MVKKKVNKKDEPSLKKVILIFIYWAFYLTLTMAFFERFHITPETVPFGFIGWMIIVELPRVLLGFAIQGLYQLKKK
jgi:hypothetical protein